MFIVECQLSLSDILQKNIDLFLDLFFGFFAQIMNRDDILEQAGADAAGDTGDIVLLEPISYRSRISPIRGYASMAFLILLSPKLFLSFMRYTPIKFKPIV